MNKILTIDIGNSNIVFGIFIEEKLQPVLRLETNTNLTPEIIKNFLVDADIFEGVSGVIVSSVVPKLDSVFEKFSIEYLKLKPIFVTKDNVDIRVNIDNPNELGADRIVNSYYGYQKYNSDLIIVDMGTATTFDIIFKEGSYEGGVIATGMKVSLDALVAKAAKLNPIKIEKPKNTIGKNTQEAMKSGIYFGYLGLIKEIIENIKRENNRDFKVVLTGGISTLFANEDFFDYHEQDLTIQGIKLIYDKLK